MPFCMNCGNEIPEGIKFCPNCGTQVGSSVPPKKVEEIQNVQQPQPTGLDKFGKFFGIILLILAIVDYNSDPAIVTIALSIGIILGAIFCLTRKFKLKGFTIIAVILATFCLWAGFMQVEEYGLFTTPTTEEVASRSTTKEKTETVTKSEPKAEPKAETKEEVAATNEEKTIPEEKTEEKAEEKTEEAQEQPQEKEQSTGVDPELKAFLDSYEEFVDEYVDFMKKYNSDPNNMISMLGEYGQMMQKYADFAEAVDAYDSDNMSTADYQYYIEVTTRCTQKMLGAF